MEAVDVVWFEGDEPVCLFEVEHAANHRDGVVRMGEVVDALDADPVAVSVFPDCQRDGWAAAVQHAAVDGPGPNRDFYGLTYTSLMTYLDTATHRDSRSTRGFLDVCTPADELT